MNALELKMTTLTIKNIPEKLCTRLKESAAQHRRSINGEAISCLEKVLVGNRVDPHDFLARARLGPPLTAISFCLPHWSKAWRVGAFTWTSARPLCCRKSS